MFVDLMTNSFLTSSLNLITKISLELEKNIESQFPIIFVCSYTSKLLKVVDRMSINLNQESRKIPPHNFQWIESAGAWNLLTNFKSQPVSV